MEFILEWVVISNWDKSLSEKLKDYVNSEFELIIGSEELGVSKPNPRIFEEAIRLSECQAKDLVYIGDSIKLDMKPALEMGIRAILVDRDNVYPNYQGERINSMRELDTLLK